MKYMIMMFSGIGSTLQDKSPEWLSGMYELLGGMDEQLRESGELVESRPLVDPEQACTVRLQDGVPVPTDGPFAEIKESLAGYWVVEADRARAVEITARVVAYTGFPMEVRQVRDESPAL